MRNMLRTFVLCAAGVILAGCLELTAAPALGKEPTATTAPSRQYAFWPPAPDSPKVQFLVAFGGADPAHEPAADKPEAIGKPYGLAVCQGLIYCADIKQPGVVVVDPATGKSRRVAAEGPSAIQQASSIAASPDGTKYISDLKAGVIRVLDAKDQFVKDIGKDLRAVSVTVGEKELYVADFQGQDVKVFSLPDGTLQRRIGKPSGDDGGFVRPIGVALDAKGNILVADTLKTNVQKFTPEGKFVAKFGQAGVNAGDMVRPKLIAMGDDGIAYVVDSALQSVLMYDTEGKFVGQFGGSGSHPGYMYLPTGVCVAKNDMPSLAAYVHPAFEAQYLVFVTNQFGVNKIAVYAVGGLKKDKTLADIAAGRVEIKADREPKSP